MRIKVRLDVKKPLKQRKKITMRNGEEVFISCKYEWLGDFCFTCGIMSRTERYCSKFLNKGTEEVQNEWGSWLRAQPRRSQGTVKSKWLRDDDDTNWEERQGRSNVSEKLGINSLKIPWNQLSQGREIRHQLHGGTKESYLLNEDNRITNFKGGNDFSNKYVGPDEEELSGLHLVERKRLRGGPGIYEIMDTDGVLGPKV